MNSKEPKKEGPKESPPASSTPRQLSARGRAHRRKRILRRFGPMAAWCAAIVTAFALGDAVFVGPTAPGAAEEITITVAAPRAAFVREVHVEVGEKVERGSTLVTLDAPGLDRQLTEARIELERLQLEVPARKGELSTDDVSVLERIERLALLAERAGLDDAIARADADRDAAELSQIDKQIARQQELVDKRLASSKVLDSLRVKRASLAQAVSQASSLLAKSRANVVAARRRYEEFRKQRDRGRTDDAVSTLLAPLLASVRAQQARIEHLLAARASLVVKAPRTGRVASLLLHAGDSVLASSPMITLIDDSPERIIAWADEIQARRITVGDFASVIPSDRSASSQGARVVALGAGLAPIPERFRTIPTEVSYGRQVILQLDARGVAGGSGKGDDDGAFHPLPGQAFDIVFLRGHPNAAIGGASDAAGDQTNKNEAAQ